MGVKDAFIFPLSPPPIPELGNATGFNFRLQDRGGNGRAALIAARNQSQAAASQARQNPSAAGAPSGDAAPPEG